MDFSNRGNRPAQQPAPQQAQKDNTNMDMPQMNSPMKSKGSSNLTLSKLSSMVVLFGGAILITALILALVFGGKTTQNKESDLINTSKYQAVFLNSQDGQVYFGKLNVYSSDTYILNDIYYVRVENPIQPEGVNQPAQPNISLAKLGCELHGPEDVMFIARDKVLYWENLKDDGQVVTAIKNYKESGQDDGDCNNNTTQNQQQTPAQNGTGTQPAGAPQQNDTPDTPTDTTTTP